MTKNQFGERVLQAAGDRYGAAQADVEFREFAGGKFGGGIDRRAGFGDDDLGHVEFRHHFYQVGGELVGFARGGAVADADEVDIVFLRQHGQRMQRAIPVAARFVRIHSGGVEQLAGSVDDGDLATGADAWVDTHRRPLSPSLLG